MRSFLAVPVALRWGEVLRALFLGHPEPGRFTERHERLLAALAAQAAIAVENARLYRAADEARRTAERANRAKDTAAVDSFRPAAEAKSLALAVTIDPMAGPIAGDSRRLQQVIWNLISNAIKFTPPGGRVEISCARGEGSVELRVADTGKGIAPHFLPRLFERFSQADSSSTRVHGGLGLGLAIVRHLVELHGGTVKAESPGEGQGASFTVKLPLAGVQPPDVTGFLSPSGIPRLPSTGGSHGSGARPTRESLERAALSG